MAYTDRHILRLIHFDNLEHILKHGIYSKNSGHIIPDYVKIIVQSGVLQMDMPRII